MNGAIVMDLPFAIGHEVAGIVEEVGPGVTKLKKGDHVVPTWMIPCGKCPECLRGRGHICSGRIGYFSSGMLLDGTSRLRDKNGKMVRHNSFVSGFSSHSVVPEDGAIPISKEMPLDQACFLGCCVPTGWGAVTNTADVQAGQSVAIYGSDGGPKHKLFTPTREIDPGLDLWQHFHTPGHPQTGGSLFERTSHGGEAYEQ